jgi:putative nucleotidyltransferase with HDIG domain
MSRTVLYVDDEPALCRAFERALRSPNLRVVTTTSPPEAVEMLGKDSFDVVASDYRMPDINGLEVLRTARVRAPHARRLLVSGRIDSDAESAEIASADVDQVLYKPWSLDELRRAVNRAVELASAWRDGRDREMELLLQALTLRDETTGKHSRRVARFTALLAQRLGMVGEELEAIVQGALMHDVGKIGLPDGLLSKPGALTDTDWELIVQHSDRGAALLSGIRVAETALAVVREHHERIDGKGYPRGLHGDAISFGARLVAVADAYDGMCTTRPYRVRKSHAEAVAELVRCQGTQFDPRMVEAFLAIPEADLEAAALLDSGPAK